MRKVALLITIIAIVMAAILLMTPSHLPKDSNTTKVQVAVSTYALYDIVSNVGKGVVDPYMIAPFGADLHTYKPVSRDLVRLQNSKLVFYSGAGLDPWSESLLEGQSFKAYEIAGFVDLRHIHDNDDDEDTMEHDEHEGHGHHHGDMDPHYWLNPENMIKATKAVSSILADAMPEYAGHFNMNSEVYITQLHMLDNRYRSELSGCKKPFIVVNHDAFGYLSERYGFESNALTGLSPESMPTASKMGQLVKFINEHQLSTVFYDPFITNKPIFELAKECNVKAESLLALGNITAEDAAKGLTYTQLMERNLLKLKHAMECE